MRKVKFARSMLPRKSRSHNNVTARTSTIILNNNIHTSIKITVKIVAIKRYIYKY